MEPLAQFGDAPVPLKRMGIPVVVLRPRHADVAPEFFPARPRPALQVVVGESMIEQLPLIQPRSMGGRQPGAPPAPAGGEVGRGFRGDVTGTVGNMTVAKINGVAYSADPPAQYFLLAGRSGGQVAKLCVGTTIKGPSLFTGAADFAMTCVVACGKYWNTCSGPATCSRLTKR